MSLHPRLQLLLQRPVGWMIVGVIAIVVWNAVLSIVSEVLPSLLFLLVALAGSVGMIVTYRWIMQRLANRQPQELSTHKAGKEAVYGIIVGSLFILMSVLLIVMLGGYHLAWNADDIQTGLVTTFAMTVAAALAEELIFRGFIFQACEQMNGSLLAMIVTSALFGAAHLANPGATLWSACAIMLEAGVLLGAAFVWRRNLWFVFGLHVAWNTLENLLGIPVSGHDPAGLFQVSSSGSHWLTGGAFGLEASLVPVAVSVLLSVPMIVIAVVKKKWIVRTLGVQNN